MGLLDRLRGRDSAEPEREPDDSGRAADDVSQGEVREKLSPGALFDIAEDLTGACAVEVEAQGGDPDQIIATVYFDDNQRVHRATLTTDGRPLRTPKPFLAELTQLAHRLRSQPAAAYLDSMDLVINDGVKQRGQFTYRD